MKSTDKNLLTNKTAPKLKVCGLTQSDQIPKLISLQTDFLGFIFYEKSLRYVLKHLSLQQISAIEHSGKVGVFVNENPEKIVETAEKAKLNFIQLHGDEDENFITELRKKLNSEIRIIKVIRIGNQNSEELQKTINQYAQTNDYILFDTDSKLFGGTGKTFDWNLLNNIEIPLPYFLSGGISEENIENISILKQKPFALDINSRFETEPGVKNISQIKIFKEKLI
ncbi:phosphoribosylanthranilate isomerase [Chryseobacterium sp. PS-8]|uniref:N-(5'-phosphoribosyl)anthranilate isomerase n=1 Tax=Chryseobacterium indicum TaxID=2766954 RepID=A0ABS9C4W8_9FLAO|nr:phosphoribosylanthranilate isomerase [Chryseobacterium sp. PS-8]MCF2219621.1 phosphoribosylanthranilate isomerase [Chryseobacterium sp. PS-8]